MAKQITEDQLNEYKEAFSLFDKDSSGSISTKELKNVLTSMGQNPTETEIKDMIEGVDKNEDGLISFPEFVMMLNNWFASQSQDQDEFMPVFKICDKDGNGEISPEELYDVIVKQLGENFTLEEIEDMIKDADTDGNKFINYLEFVSIMRGDI